MEELHIDALERAVERLAEGMARYGREPHDDQLRDGLIQRFKFTYEISHRLLYRCLRLTSPSPDMFDSIPFVELIRPGNQLGLLRSDWPAWRGYRDLRARQPYVR